MLRLALIINVVILFGIFFPPGPPHFLHWTFPRLPDLAMLGLIALILLPRRCAACHHFHVGECKRKVYQHYDYYLCGCKKWVSRKP